MLLLLLLMGCAKQPGTKEHEVSASADSVRTQAAGEDQLLLALRHSFQGRNPKLEQVGVLDLKAWDFVGPRLVLGWAIVKDKVFRGDFNDEMFGVFVVDESLTRVERVIDLFPTERWYDYEERFGRFTADSVEVLGKGATYGDGPVKRAYKWR